MSATNFCQILFIGFSEILHKNRNLEMEKKVTNAGFPENFLFAPKWTQNGVFFTFHEFISLLFA